MSKDLTTTELKDKNPPRLDEVIDEKIRLKTSLSIKYWYPTIISAIAITASVVYWYLSTVKSIEERLSKLEYAQTVPASDDNIVESFQYFRDISINSESGLSKKQELEIQDLAFTLNQRKDLVVVITGYSKGMEGISKEEQVNYSRRVALSLSDKLVSSGLSLERIFIQGRGPDVPVIFPGKKWLLECIYYAM